MNASYRLATVCFFGGVLLTALLDIAVHAMLHWAAHRRRRVEGGSGSSGPPCCSGAGDPHSTAELAAFASPASSECGEELPFAVQHSYSDAQQPHLCSVCAATDAAHSKQQGSISGGRESEMEMGRIETASKAPPAAASLRIQVRRLPCSAGNPGCCGPTALCHSSGMGLAAADIAPGTEAAEVVAVLQSDPHTQDLLRMGEC